MRFRDRGEAGRRLAEELEAYGGRDDVLVLALPTGGVPVAWEVARSLRAPLDVLLVRKLGVPGREELAMGAIASGGIRVVDEEVTSALGVTEDVVARVAAEEQQELERREREYRSGRQEPTVEGRTVIVVDDGLATGSTMAAAAMTLRPLGPRAMVIAVPVAAPGLCEAFRESADEVICCATPDPFGTVGRWYDDFAEVADSEVRELLARAADGPPSGA